MIRAGPVADALTCCKGPVSAVTSGHVSESAIATCGSREVLNAASGCASISGHTAGCAPARSPCPVGAVVAGAICPCVSPEVDQPRGFIDELYRVRNVLRGACGAGSSKPPVIPDLFGFVCRQSVLGKRLDKRDKVLPRFFGHIQGVLVKGHEHITDRMLPVKELPHVDAGGAQAKTTTGIDIEQNGPVVKLLPEHDQRVGYGLVTVFHGSTSVPSSLTQAGQQLL